MSLTAYFYRFPSSEYQQLISNLERAGYSVEPDDEGYVIRDPESKACVPINFDFYSANQIAVSIVDSKPNTRTLLQKVGDLMIKMGAVKITAGELIVLKPSDGKI